MPGDAEPPPSPWRHRALTLLVFLVSSAAVVLPGALGDSRVSVFDEVTHADWVAALTNGDLVRRGDTIDPDLLVEWACRGWAYETGLPACAEVTADPASTPAASFPARGLNYNAFHPPGYYVPTAVGAALGRAIVPTTDLVTSARVMGVGWSVLAMVGVYAVARELGARVSVARAAGVTVVGFPLVAHLLSIVNNDAAVLAVGALVTWVGLRTIRGPVRWWWLAGVGAVAGITKVVLLPAVLGTVVLLGMVALWWPRHGSDRRRLVAAGALIAMGFVATTGVWLGLQSVRAGNVTYVDPIPGDVTGGDVPLALAGVALDTFPPTAGARSPMAVSPGVLEIVTTWADVGNLILTAVPFALVFAGLGAATARRRALASVGAGGDGSLQLSGMPAADSWWVGVPLGASTMVGLVVGAVGLNTQHWLAKGSAISVLHARYGLALLAALLGGLALLSDRHRVTRVALWVFALTGVVVGVIGGLSW